MGMKDQLHGYPPRHRTEIAACDGVPVHHPADLKRTRFMKRDAVGFHAETTRELSGALNPLLADLFALYIKTKNFHWHVSGPHFRDYHLLLDEQADQILATTDAVAERVRKIGGGTLPSIGHLARPP